VVVSRADELRRWSIRWDLERELPEPILFEAPNGIICDAPQAVEFIHDLESTLAQRDKRIAELNSQLAYEDIDAQIDIARTEVPEWCKAPMQIAAKISRSATRIEQDRWCKAMSVELGYLSDDQLRACGIEVP